MASGGRFQPLAICFGVALRLARLYLVSLFSIAVAGTVILMAITLTKDEVENLYVVTQNFKGAPTQQFYLTKAELKSLVQEGAQWLGQSPAKHKTRVNAKPRASKRRYSGF